MLKHLKTKKGRDESGLFMVEGEKFISEIPAQYEIKYYVIARRYADTNDISRYKKRARCEVVRDSIFDRLAGTVTPQGIIAVCEKLSWTLGGMCLPNGFILMGECLNDPGNIGALARTAAAAGASGMILTKGSCDIFSPKVLRAAAGAVLRLPIITEADMPETLAALKKTGMKILAAHPRGNALPYEIDLREAFCLLVGNEAHGLTAAATGLADTLVRLPMADEIESLNASVAGGILMYEAVRQRI